MYGGKGRCFKNFAVILVFYLGILQRLFVQSDCRYLLSKRRSPREVRGFIYPMVIYRVYHEVFSLEQSSSLSKVESILDLELKALAFVLGYGS